MENGITEFTISSTFSSLIPTLAEFAKHGFQMAGLTEVKANYTDFQTHPSVGIRLEKVLLMVNSVMPFSYRKGKHKKRRYTP